MATIDDYSLKELRRDLHTYPELGWEEFRTTALVAESLDERGFDISLGADALNAEARYGVPDARRLDAAAARAIDEGAPAAYIELMDGITGLVATKRYGDGTGPTVGVRVDLDALDVTEATRDTHRPAADSFASTHPGVMHACGHDGHTAIGVGIARELDRMGGFNGTLVLFFQPAEEGGRGGDAMSQTDYVANLEYLFAVHLGLGVDTGTVVSSYERPLASRKYDVVFEGSSAHAGKEPHKGRNALLAAVAAIQNLYAISRHGDGVTRLNVGQVHAPNPQNSIADRTEFRLEVRGGTPDIVEFLANRAQSTIEGAATMHDVDASMTVRGKTTTFTGDEPARTAVSAAAAAVPAVQHVDETRPFPASEDASFLIRRVQHNGGTAAYVGIGTDHPTGHHTPTFDIDETSLKIGVDVLTGAIRRV